VNSSYGASVSANALAALIVELGNADAANALVFSFFSDVPLAEQRRFISVMHLDLEAVIRVAKRVAALSGYALPLAE
jgi:hypothetical protein